MTWHTGSPQRRRLTGVVADLSCDELTTHALLALELAERFSGRPERFEEFAAEWDYEFDEWLLNLPVNPARAGMVDYAVRVADALTVLDSRYEADLACAAATILARAGRAQQARARVESNVARIGESAFAWLASGEAQLVLGDVEAAAAAYEAALEVAEAGGDLTEMSDVHTHVSDFLEVHPHLETSLREPRQRVGITHGPDGDMVVRATTVVGAPTVRVPRNAPCPCGSGRKIKRCCGGAK